MNVYHTSSHSHCFTCYLTITIIFLLTLPLLFFLQACCVHWLLLSCSFLASSLLLCSYSSSQFLFFLLSTALNVCVCVCVCVSACLTVCVCSNLSKHSLVWELRDPCVWCVVWEQHEQQIHHTHSCAYTHTQHIHTPQGLIAETTCNSSWI